MKPTAIALALVGAAALPLADPGSSAVTSAGLAVAGATLGAAAATDLAEHRIPNRIVLPAAAACAVLDIISGISATTLAGLAAVASLLLVSLVVPSALGMGDIKLMLVIVLGVQQSAIRALIFGLLVAGIGAAAVLVSEGRQARRRSLPLAPFLALGTLLAVL